MMTILASPRNLTANSLSFLRHKFLALIKKVKTLYLCLGGRKNVRLKRVKFNCFYQYIYIYMVLYLKEIENIGYLSSMKIIDIYNQ